MLGERSYLQSREAVNCIDRVMTGILDTKLPVGTAGQHILPLQKRMRNLPKTIHILLLSNEHIRHGWCEFLRTMWSEVIPKAHRCQENKQHINSLYSDYGEDLLHPLDAFEQIRNYFSQELWNIMFHGVPDIKGDNTAPIRIVNSYGKQIYVNNTK